MKILGIDNGFYGGIVGLEKFGVGCTYTMPIITYDIGNKKKRKIRHDLDGPEIARLFKFLKPDFIWIEKAQPFPKQGGVSNFSIGGSFNRIRGIVEALEIRHDFTRPQAWQKVMFVGMAKTDTKKMAYMACCRLWPRVDWKVNGKPHSGLCDAALIAEYGRRVLAGLKNA